MRERRLNDGRRLRIVEIFHDPGALRARLRGLGFDAEMRRTAWYFPYGWGRPR